MLKMATYPGMSLGGEVRESISLDEDDLSDVEDEVFIRDGKNSYKMAEELNVKRPLMAPRRKPSKPDIAARLRARPPCRAFCKPCCYVTAALGVLIGLIALVVVLVSIYPLPLDRVRDWIVSRTGSGRSPVKLLPCSNLRLRDVWTTSLPILTTDSPVRTLDLGRDGVEDVIFGFGTGDNYNALPPDIFCPIFLGVAPPCEGGIVALNGSTGAIVWRYWTNDTIFSLQCTADLNGDGLEDCLGVGVEGTLVALDTRNGSVIWKLNHSKMDVFVANFVPDQDDDSVADVLSSHTSLEGEEGHLVLISGKTGKEIRRTSTPGGAKTFFMPQLLRTNDSYSVLIGTGSPSSPGNLSIVSLESIVKENSTITGQTIHQDRHKGILTQSVLVDITGDQIPDIIVATYNSTVVAINGFTRTQIWNFTVPDAESNVIPTPGYFNNDNITDFLVVYQKYDNILNYNYTKTFIIDGKTGRPIYDKPISGAISSQMGGLSLAMESHGYDMFLFWTRECISEDVFKTGGDSNSYSDICRQKQYNNTSITRLNALNQYDQPPGFEIYSSVNRSSLEFGKLKSPLKQIQEFFAKHPKFRINNSSPGQSEMSDSNYEEGPNRKIRIHKYGSSSFRHKDNRQGIVKDYMSSNSENVGQPRISEPVESKYDPDFDWQTNQANSLMNVLPPGDSEVPSPDFGNYNLDESADPLFNQNSMMFDEGRPKSNRDPRSRQEPTTSPSVSSTKSSKKKNLPDANNRYGVYDYKNVKLAKHRLLHDLNNLPTEILRDTYLKNRESQLRRSKFEQRDINSHIDRMKENEEVKKILEDEKNRIENGSSVTLWDLESEKEMQDKENGLWRGKREVNRTLWGERRVSSVGAIVKSLNQSNNSIDIIFVTYWQPSKSGEPISLEEDVSDCIEDKLSNTSEDQAHAYHKTTEEERRALFTQECLAERETLKSDFPYFDGLYQLNLGQMTVYRITIECECNHNMMNTAEERCAKFLPQEQQGWSQFMGRKGDGVFITRN